MPPRVHRLDALSCCFSPGWAARLLLGLLLFTLPAAVQAQFSYTTGNGTLTITKYTGPGGAVTIPSTIDGLPVGVVGEFSFGDTTNLTRVTIPSSVTTIEGRAFDRCTGLTNVTIPNSVTTIGYRAFRDCIGLTSIALPNSVTNILFQAFYGCANLIRVTIPNSVTTIGYGAFFECTRLKAIEVEALNPVYSSSDGVLFDQTRTTLLQCPGGKAGSYTLPNSVTTIADRAFYGCTNLTSVTIPNSVTIIGNYAFGDCTGLTSIVLPNSVTTIGPDWFSGCTGLTSIVLPNSVTTIVPYAFSGCTGLTNVTIPNSLTSIGLYAFEGCSNLTTVRIPSGVTTIGNYAFSECAGLKAIEVEALNPAYSSWDGVLFNKNQTKLLQYPGGKAGSFTIPNSVTNIEHQAFLGSANLTRVTIPNNVTTIGYGAFFYCTRLKAIEVEALNPVYSSLDGVLFDQARTTLLQCPGGKAGSYTPPNSVTSIGYAAFNACAELTRVTIPNSVTTLWYPAFTGCARLMTIEVEALNPAYSSVDGVLFDKDRTTLLRCPGGRTGNYTVPNSITTIGDVAFHGCANLTSVTIPENVTTIGYGAFVFCPSLTGVYFQGNAPGFNNNDIWDEPFEGSDGLTVYFLAGTSGWGATKAGRPTAVWSRPLILSDDPGFGVGTGGFGFTISWAPNASVVVEASPAVAAPVWTPVSTNLLTTGTSQFNDPQWTEHSDRLYRLTTP